MVCSDVGAQGRGVEAVSSGSAGEFPEPRSWTWSRDEKLCCTSCRTGLREGVLARCFDSTDAVEQDAAADAFFSYHFFFVRQHISPLVGMFRCPFTKAFVAPATSNSRSPQARLVCRQKFRMCVLTLFVVFVVVVLVLLCGVVVWWWVVVWCCCVVLLCGVVVWCCCCGVVVLWCCGVVVLWCCVCCGVVCACALSWGSCVCVALRVDSIPVCSSVQNFKCLAPDTNCLRHCLS